MISTDPGPDFALVAKPPGRNYRFWIIVFSVGCFLLQGCATYRSTYPGKPLSEQVRSGDKVRVRTVAGEQYEFAVSEANLEGIYNQDTFIAYTDIERMEVLKKNVHDSGATLAAVGIIAGVAIILIIVNGVEDSVESVFDGGN